MGVIALLAAVTYGGILAHRFVVRSPHFRVQHIEISPTVHVTAQEIRRLANLPPGANLFAVDRSAVAKRVRRHPWIATARVRRQLPNTLRIEVTEQVAAGAVLLQGDGPNGAFYLVSSQGVAFKRASPAELEGLPLITGIRREDYHDRRGQARASIREGLDVARRYAARSGRPPLGEVHVDPVDGVTLYTARQKVQVLLGRGQVAARLRRLDRIWAELRRRGQRAAVIRLDDDRHPQRVAVRLATAESTGPS